MFVRSFDTRAVTISCSLNYFYMKKVRARCSKMCFCMAIKLHSASWVNNNYCQSEWLLQYNDVLMKVCNTVFSFIFNLHLQTISHVQWINRQNKESDLLQYEVKGTDKRYPSRFKPEAIRTKPVQFRFRWLMWLSHEIAQQYSTKAS